MVITREDLDGAFARQKQMTQAAIQGPGLESYMSNLGFDTQAMIGWTHDYAMGNIQDARPDWEDTDVTFVASLLSRALIVGLILGRQTKA